MSDRFDLQRFVTAQEPVYSRVVAELRDGRKRSHWMWFIFPQLAGLGHSAMAQRYAVSGLDEARAYMDHAVLGPRLLECTQLVLGHAGQSAHAIFGSPDDTKLRSSMTLFAAARPDVEVFQRVIDSFYEGKADERTLAGLRG